MFDYGADLQNAYDEGYKKGKADAVRHGRWIETCYDEYKCSACEKVVREEILYAIKPSDRECASMHIANYCPNCGAKMDEEETK